MANKPVATSEEVGTNEGGKKENDMADQWLYSRDGTDHGPVPSSTLVELAKNGELLPTDLLWKEGMAEWKPASSFPKLFPPKSSADEMPVFVVNDTKPKAGNANDKTRARQATSSLKAHAQTAGRLAKLTAEKTRIVTVSLPLAYAELGKHRYETREDEQEFLATFGELDAIASAITENSKATPIPPASSFADKAKKVASQGIQLANSQKLSLQQKALFAKLGKEVYTQQGEQAGPESLVKAIEPLVGRLATLERELAENVKKAGGKKRLWLIAGGVLFGLIILGGMFGEAENGGEQQGKSASRSGTRRGSASKPSAVQHIDDRIAELKAMLPKAEERFRRLHKASQDRSISKEERRALDHEVPEAYRRMAEIKRELNDLPREREVAILNEASRQVKQSPDGGKSLFMGRGAKAGENYAKVIEQALQEGKTAVWENELQRVKNFANGYLERINIYKNTQALNRKHGWQDSPDLLESLQETEWEYEGFMSKAGKYVR